MDDRADEDRDRVQSSSLASQNTELRRALAELRQQGAVNEDALRAANRTIEGWKDRARRDDAALEEAVDSAYRRGQREMASEVMRRMGEARRAAFDAPDLQALADFSEWLRLMAGETPQPEGGGG